jgi:hypothetical protein
MTNSINEAIASRSAHDLANELADAGVSAEQRGNYGADDAVCEIAGYGRVFFRDARWVVQATDGHEYLIDNDELAAELLEVVAMTQRL